MHHITFECDLVRRVRQPDSTLLAKMQLGKRLVESGHCEPVCRAIMHYAVIEDTQCTARHGWQGLLLLAAMYIAYENAYNPWRPEECGANHSSALLHLQKRICASCVTA